jgi:hypothetical protein
MGIHIAVNGSGLAHTQLETCQDGHQGFPRRGLRGVVPLLQTHVFHSECLQKERLGIGMRLLILGHCFLLGGNGIDGPVVRHQKQNEME